jgi:IS30 family transposase
MPIPGRSIWMQGGSGAVHPVCQGPAPSPSTRLSQHAQFTIETGVPVFFAGPRSPWQRGMNENTNGLLRQYFLKGTDLSRWNAEELEAVAHPLNSRARKILGWRTPAEALNDQLGSLQQTGVATTEVR